MSRNDAFALTHFLERGWYDGSEARDPNPTLNGVTQKAFDKYRRKLLGPNFTPLSVAKMTPAQEAEIYGEYYDNAHAGELPSPIDALHFAYAFNAGPSGEPWAAIEVLQRVLGVTADGKVGPMTRAAIARATDTPAHIARLYYDLLIEHLTEYRRMIKNPRLAPNARSWMMRLIEAHKAARLTLFP